MTLYLDLTKNSPEDIVSQLMGICRDAAQRGTIENEPVKVDFKKKMWVVTWVNTLGEFSEMFKSEENAVKFLVELHQNMGVRESSIRQTLA